MRDIRKGTVLLLALLLAVMPALGLFADHASAATSRVAVIQSLKGTVQVKKAGGSKQFRAFAKMTLNEGDVLTTSSGSSAVLQFSNGTSEDDKMTVSANSTLTFSKLSDKNGTRTKVSLFNGTAWVDVKSIQNKDDEFTLQTPTAVMGVRGTHFLVTVDPVTGMTKMTVVAGRVSTLPTGAPPSLATDVKPGDNALVTGGQASSGEISIAPADLELLLAQSNERIIEAIVSAAADIVKENREKRNTYFLESDLPDPDELDRLKTNLDNLMGAIIYTALRNGKISKERVDQLLADAQARTGETIDLNKRTITLSEEQKRAQEQMREREEAVRREAAERQRQERERQDQELLQKLEEQRKQLEEEKRKAALESQKRLIERYEQQLSEAEKERFQRDQQQRLQEMDSSPNPSANPGTGSGSGPVSSPSPNPGSSDARLSMLKLKSDEIGEIPLAFDPNTLNYKVQIPGTIAQIQMLATAAQLNARVEAVEVNGDAVEQVNGIYPLTVTNGGKLTIRVVAPDQTAKRQYELRFTAASVERDDWLQSMTAKAGDQVLHLVSLGDAGHYGLYIPQQTDQLDLQFVLNGEEEAGYLRAYRADSDEELGRTDETGNVHLPLSGSGYHHFRFERYASDDYPLDERLFLTVLNGGAAPMWEEQHPFDLMADTPLIRQSPMPISYTPSASKPGHYEVTAEADFQTVSLQDGAERVIAVYDQRQGAFLPKVSGSWFKTYYDLSPVIGENEYRVFVADKSGHYVHDYALTLNLTMPQPVGVQAWSVAERGQSASYPFLYNMEFGTFYADLPFNLDGAELHLTFDPAKAVHFMLEQYIHESYYLIEEKNISATAPVEQLELPPLTPGVNSFRFVLFTTDDEKVYYFDIVRGPLLTLMDIRLENNSVTQNVYQTGPYSFTAFANLDDGNDFSLMLNSTTIDNWRTKVYDSSGEEVPNDGSFLIGELETGVHHFTMHVQDNIHPEPAVYDFTIVVDPGINMAPFQYSGSFRIEGIANGVSVGELPMEFSSESPSLINGYFFMGNEPIDLVKIKFPDWPAGTVVTVHDGHHEFPLAENTYTLNFLDGGVHYLIVKAESGGYSIGYLLQIVVVPTTS